MIEFPSEEEEKQIIVQERAEREEASRKRIEIYKNKFPLFVRKFACDLVEEDGIPMAVEFFFKFMGIPIPTEHDMFVALTMIKQKECKIINDWFLSKNKQFNMIISGRTITVKKIIVKKEQEKKPKSWFY
jgi:hypothetical protein